jgi:hypothetical protein
VWNEFIPFFFPEQFFEMVEEYETFFVGDTGECVVGIGSLEVYA